MPGTQAQFLCRNYMLEEVKKSCDAAYLQPFNHKWTFNQRDLPMWNVVGEQNWEKATTRVVILTHWDSRPFADQEPGSGFKLNPILAADDGASGVAVMLELMRVLKDRLPKNVGVQYLLEDGEDLGPGDDEMFLGAIAYADKLTTIKPNYGILLDMIGDADLKVPMEQSSMRLAPGLMRAIYRHAQFVGLGNVFPSVEGPDVEDDHLVINKAGIPCIDLIDFDYPAWHTTHDTVDKCSKESLFKVGKLLETWLMKEDTFTINSTKASGV